ncbi:MAG: hypothetical protein A2Y62_19920 [Candidatus Fischerbacteria bacterium RBG_13_37_8]|uniref:Bulb-type lectin domain-containing protein n=1 Tax=Candidatus Fischerbacteria bacterium RBG_13_37_8 TaxID=1817863 RepID=A0A1F5VNZ6_9BACT|nr:MAG: hypothetical protein A2Y62_19920 [Candidatus Fischerbacteria bacterium RBG_13_37_8]
MKRNIKFYILGFAVVFYAIFLTGDALGQHTWARVFDAGNAYLIQPTSDGEYIAAGNRGNNIWVFKLDSSGTITWQNVYGDID